MPASRPTRSLRDAWLHHAVADTLDDTERGLVMLCVPLLERLAADRARP